MFTTIIFIIILSVLIIAHEFGHFIAAKRKGVGVEQFALGFGPQLFKIKKGGTEYSICAIPLGGYVKLAGDNLEEYKGKANEYFSKTVLERFQIIFCGPLVNYVLGFLFFWMIFFVGYPTLTTKIGGLMDGFGAKEAGLAVGDKIMAIDGEKVNFWDQMQEVVQSKKNTASVKLSILRGSKEFTVDVRIGQKELQDQLGKKHSVVLLGITPFDEFVKIRHGFGESLILGLERTWELTAVTYQGLWFLVSGQLSVRESVTGPLGIFYITSKVANMGIIPILHLMAILSISLAIFNLLPLPVLDGGHILFLLIEKIRGKPLSLKTERMVTQIGVTIIICLALFVTYNDIIRLFGDKIHKMLVK